ncbi:hypothetical protein [Calycomorphotria hydatis]|uniref:Uncharacterized protein n=1 Tax=Calycomorphotria hydatis TaxID=2528027 RepID=A0A517TD99_9PLAN|nr:hypothetical protein [Calycomorphotria hydatis]QDT66350.1 hypothetical protein V22_36160 [Calycomorphotria hydatis]
MTFDFFSANKRLVFELLKRHEESGPLATIHLNEKLIFEHTSPTTASLLNSGKMPGIETIQNVAMEVGCSASEVTRTYESILWDRDGKILTAKLHGREVCDSDYRVVIRR